jgi:pimeloyl-ACP methyl ester carboxylesterase
MTAVFMHGVPETPAVWGPLLPHIKRTDFVTLHLPGFGIPSPEGWTATKEEYVLWLIDQLEAIGEPVDLVGHDWGGGFGYRVITTRPDLIRSWVIDVAGLFHPDYQWHAFANIWQTPEEGEKYFADTLALPVESRAQLYESVGMTPEVAMALGAAIDEEMARCILALYRSAIQPTLVAWGKNAEAAAVRPGLVMVPTADPFSSDSTLAVETAERMGATVQKLEGSGHWWMHDDPAGKAAMLESFWASL